MRTMVATTIKRGRDGQAHRNFVRITAESSVHELYAYQFLERLERELPHLMLPKYTSIREAQERGIKMMADEKYWKALNEVFSEMAKEEDILQYMTHDITNVREKISQHMGQIVIRAERMRMEKALANLGLDNAWEKLLNGMLWIAQNNPELGMPLTASETNAYARDVFLDFSEHRSFIGQVFVIGPEEAGEYTKQMLEHSGLTNQELRLIDESLMWKIPPQSSSFFIGKTPKGRGTYLNEASLEGIRNVSSRVIREGGMISSALRDIAETKELIYRGESRFQQRYVDGTRKVAAKIAEVIPIRRKAVFRTVAEKFAAHAAVGAAAAAAAYFIVWPLLEKGVDKMEKTLAPTPIKTANALEEELKPICAFSGNRKEIIKMLNGIKVGGRKLTSGEKIRAVKIAKLSSTKYSGNDLERYIQITAILQFAPGHTNRSVATISNEIANTPSAGDAAQTARKKLEELSGKK